MNCRGKGVFCRDKIKKLIHNLDKARVLVIGDFALDEMIYGTSHRISREAPVLILKYEKTNNILGAASNAANNISKLNGGKVSAMGVIGNDYHGNILRETMIKESVDVSYLYVDETRQTTTKTRVLGCSTQSVTQQIIRVDREVRKPVSGATETKIIDTMRKVINDYDGILLSDYGIGMMTPDIISEATKLASENGKIIVVDAQDDLQRFKNVTLLTPNQPDVEKTLGYKIKDRETLLKAGQDLLGMTMADSVLITRGGEGMILFEKIGNITEIPAFNRTEVFDVTGAGDTVAGTVVLGLCSGGTGVEAAILGNLAASLVVRKFGAATTTQDELLQNMEGLNLDNILDLSFNHC